jgi:hypothetical protein
MLMSVKIKHCAMIKTIQRAKILWAGTNAIVLEVSRKMRTDIALQVNVT